MWMTPLTPLQVWKAALARRNCDEAQSKYKLVEIERKKTCFQ